jgi:hypothetical protein
MGRATAKNNVLTHVELVAQEIWYVSSEKCYQR